MAEVTITKIDAARRQLRMAIDLWFADGDPVPIHTLACAAYQIVHDLHERQKKPRPPMLLDVECIKDEYKNKIRDALKQPANFMKHGNRGKAGAMTSLTFDPELSVFFISFTIQGLIYLKQDLSAEEQAFNIWQRLHRPDYFTKAWQDLVKNNLDAIAVAGLHALSKQHLYRRVRDSVAARLGR